MGRWKGEQRGTLRRTTTGYYGRWREFVQDETGKIEWKQVKRKLCDVSDGKAEAIRLLNESVSRAGGPSACPQGMATFQQFVEVRFEADRIAKLKPNGQRYYREQLKQINKAVPTGSGVYGTDRLNGCLWIGTGSSKGMVIRPDQDDRPDTRHGVPPSRYSYHTTKGDLHSGEVCARTNPIGGGQTCIRSGSGSLQHNAVRNAKAGVSSHGQPGTAIPASFPTHSRRAA